MQTIKKHEFELFCDCEGDTLCRHGTLSLLQLMIASLNHTWVIDITVLCEKAFDTKGPGPEGRSLREILEDDQIPKMFLDVRNDADALFSHCGVRLQCPIDIQLMELASRDHRLKRGVRQPLEKCITTASSQTMKWYELV
jgi:exonuclease 3'-5' domain-containing protein 1